MTLFEKLELDAYEVSALFEMLSEEDGVADYEEFLSGAMRMKGSARTIDAVRIMHEQVWLKRQLDDVITGLDHIHKGMNAGLHLKDAWSAPHTPPWFNRRARVAGYKEQVNAPQQMKCDTLPI